MSKPSSGQQVAVIPYSEVMLHLAKTLLPRCGAVGIEIALVSRRGEVLDVDAN